MGKENKFKDGSYNGVAYTASELIRRKCDGSDYDRGSIETVQAATDNTAKILSSLIEVLYKKKIITYDEVKEIAGVYYDSLDSEEEGSYEDL